jgi:hypothetical protein
MLLSGVTLDDIPTIDQSILENYLENVEENTVIIGQAIYSGAFGKNPFYDSREKFETSGGSYFLNPPQPKRYEANSLEGAGRFRREAMT